MSTRPADRAPAISVRDAYEVLMRAGEVLTGSLALDETLRNGVQLMVPALADWAAVLVIQEDGSEREFTTTHPDPVVEAGILSIRRRRRRDGGGGSESLEVWRSGEPLLATDLPGGLAPDLTADERQMVGRLTPVSYMVVPLRARGRIVGALTLLSTTPGRHYTAQDCEFAQTLAGRFALAIDNAQLYEAVSGSLGLLDTLFDSAPVGLAYLDLDRRYVRINEALAALDGRDGDAHIGRKLEDVLGAEAAIYAQAHRTVVETGEPVLEEEIAGDDRHSVASFTPVRGLDGGLLGVGVVVIDVTERRRLLEAERSARARADVLARAGAVLDTSLDYQQTLRNLADVVVPAVADWCSIRARDADDAIEHVTTTHVDPEKRALAEAYERRFPPDPNTGAFAVMRTGVPAHVPVITDEMLAGGISDPEQLDAVLALGIRSVVIAPLAARGRNVGAITLATAESGRVFEAEDVQLAEELGRRAGVAMDNARLYSERARIAHTLQARLLPSRLPEIPGARLAARYRAAGELNEVGGDFYDVFERPAGGWALLVGDVSGKGAEAAAVTALARYTLRTAAMDAGPPSHALMRLNDAMHTESDTKEFVTVVLVYAIPAGDGLALQIALGGHPAALVRRADGRVEPVGEAGMLLGIDRDPPIPDVGATLAPGDAMLLYTDGVTEAGPRHAMLGEHGLMKLLASGVPAGPEQLVARVEAAAVAAQAGEPRDDIALLAVEATET